METDGRLRWISGRLPRGLKNVFQTGRYSQGTDKGFSEKTHGYLGKGIL
jgi:hypothetical protein